MVSLPVVARSFTLYGKVEQHRCSFFNKQGTEAKGAANSSYTGSKDLVLICLQSHWPRVMKSLTGTGPAQSAPLNLESKADPRPAFPTMCAEVILPCESLRSTYFPTLFPIRFPITPPFPIPALQPFLALLSVLLEGKPGLPTGKEGFQFAKGQGDMDGSDEASQACKGKADSSLLGGWSKSLLHQPNAGTALSSFVWCCRGARRQTQSPEVPGYPQIIVLFLSQYYICLHLLCRNMFARCIL